MNIGDEEVTLHCGHVVQRKNLQTGVVRLLIEDETAQQLHARFITHATIPRTVKRGVMETAFDLIDPCKRAKENAPLAFGMWLLAISETFPPGTQLDSIGEEIISGKINPANFIAENRLAA